MRLNVVTVICLLRDINISTMGILEILKDNNLTLDDLGSDIFRIFRNATVADLNKHSLILDLSTMAMLSSINISKDTISEEVQHLVDNVQYRLETIHIQGRKLSNIYFELPDTVIFRYT